MPRLRWSIAACVVLVAGFGAGRAGAELDLERAAAELGRRGPGSRLPRALFDASAGRSTALLRSAGRVPEGGVRVGRDLFVARSPVGVPGDAAARERAGVYLWTPPRRLLLDRAAVWTGALEHRRTTGGTGSGAIVGVVDSGVDLSHPDLRDASGQTRVAWWIDFSRPPAGRHPELEAELGCAGPSQCAIFSADDLDELARGDTTEALPRDSVGHGTHVASLAAGSGASDPAYAGIAPDATLIVARVTRGGDGAVFDPDVLLATRFVFERAAELGKPAVVNLSLGGDLGAHDGSSALERALGEMVGPEHPGRAIVVAAGNSGELFTAPGSGYPEPFGIHTEVHVPTHTSVRVPVLTPPVGSSVTRASVLIWIAAAPGDRLAIAVEDAGGPLTDTVEAGRVEMFGRGAVEIAVANGITGSGSALTDGTNSALVSIDGQWPAGAPFALRLHGSASARLWVQSGGDLSPSVGSIGAVFPRARRAGTISVPATSPELIAVGATLNRTGFVDYQGEHITLSDPSLFGTTTAGAVAAFSAAGPTSDGRIKPDILAPGALVGGAMAASADPRPPGAGGMFSSRALCPGPSACLVLDDHHAISSGTSMSAPIVTGAVALLFDAEPSLTQDRVRALLRAGATAPIGTQDEQQSGPGVVDIPASLRALELEREDPPPEVPAPAHSRFVLARSFVYPDPELQLEGLLQLRDARGRISDGAPSELELRVEGGQLVGPLRRAAPGLYGFAIAARERSGGSELRLSLWHRGALLLRRTVPIAVDPHLVSDEVAARGGCQVGAGPSRTPAWIAAALFGLTFVGRRRRRQSLARYNV